MLAVLEHESGVESLLVCIVVVLLVTGLIYVIGQRLAPAYAGIVAFVILVLGLLLCLL